MKKIALAFAAVMMMSTPAFADDCDNPLTAPEIPSGESSTKEQMTTVQSQMKAYLAATQEQMGCLEIAMKKDKKASSKYNDVVEDMQKLAAKYNKEVRTFKEKNPGA